LVIRLFGTSKMIEKKIEENGEHFCILVCYFFSAK